MKNGIIRFLLLIPVVILSCNKPPRESSVIIENTQEIAWETDPLPLAPVSVLSSINVYSHSIIIRQFSITTNSILKNVKGVDFNGIYIGEGYGITVMSIGLLNEMEIEKKAGKETIILFNKRSANLLVHSKETSLVLIKLDSFTYSHIPALKLSFKQNLFKEKIFWEDKSSSYVPRLIREARIIAIKYLNENLTVLVINEPVAYGETGSAVYNEAGECIGIVFGRLDKETSRGVILPAIYIKKLSESFFR